MFMFLEQNKKYNISCVKEKRSTSPLQTQKNTMRIWDKIIVMLDLLNKGQVDPKRLSDEYSHVCPKWNLRFAQKAGVKQGKN